MVDEQVHARVTREQLDVLLDALLEERAVA
jgi:hypothetical protein